MDFGKRVMTKARVRAFFAPRRSRVVNSGEEEGLRNPSFSRRPRIAGSAGAARALRSRHNENDPVFDKIRQIHAFIPQIHAFFRQIQDSSKRGKNIKSLKIKRLWESRGSRRGYFARPRRLRASARIFAPSPRRHPVEAVRERPAPADANSSPNGRFPNRGAAPGRGCPYETMNPRMDWPGTPVCRRAPRFWIPAFAGMTGFAAARGGGEILAAVSMLFPVGSKGRRGWPFAVIPAKAGIQGFDSWRNPIGD